MGPENRHSAIGLPDCRHETPLTVIRPVRSKHIPDIGILREVLRQQDLRRKFTSRNGIVTNLERSAKESWRTIKIHDRHAAKRRWLQPFRTANCVNNASIWFEIVQTGFEIDNVQADFNPFEFPVPRPYISRRTRLLHPTSWMLMRLNIEYSHNRQCISFIELYQIHTLKRRFANPGFQR